MAHQPLNSLNDLMMEELQDMWSAEQMVSAEMNGFAMAAGNGTLKQKLQDYSKDAASEAQRLRECFDMLGAKPGKEKCEAMEGIIEEAEDLLERGGRQAVLDAAIIAEVQRIKHYEIAGYGCLRTYADMLDKKGVANVAAEALHDEEAKDKEMTALAMSTINPQAKSA
ncbi:MAG: DUF892 family protein [Armatimonadota bacterium]